METPHFVIKNKFQKGGLYQDLLTPLILSDVCQKVTGNADYTVEFDNEGYNIGRLAVLKYGDKVVYISFSELEIRSRNSSFQSFPSALSRFILEENENKEICFYFHPSTTGNFETSYFIFMYRLMKTANVNFLNATEYLKQPIFSFSTPEDILIYKDRMRSKNAGNRSTYLTRDSNDKLQLFGKTYGANKYETTLLCLALSEISTTEIELYEIEEGGLTKLPQTSKDAIESLGKVKIYSSNRTIERNNFERNENLRSARYIYNLLERLGNKKCTFCKCEIPQIIQGAHIWSVADIKKENQLTLEEKLDIAIDGNNGLWLCNNHHKLLDMNIIMVSSDGSLKYKTELDTLASNFIYEISTSKKIDNEIITVDFKKYLGKRNEKIQEGMYSNFLV